MNQAELLQLRERLEAARARACATTAAYSATAVAYAAGRVDRTAYDEPERPGISWDGHS